MNPKQSLITSLTCQLKQAMTNHQNTIQPTKNKKSQLKIQIEIQIENLKQNPGLRHPHDSALSPKPGPGTRFDYPAHPGACPASQRNLKKNRKICVWLLKKKEKTSRRKSNSANQR